MNAAKGQKALDDGRYDEAEIDFRKAIQKAPSMGDAWYGLGLSEFKQNKLSDAYKDLTQAVTLLHGREDAESALGDVCLSGYLGDPTHPAKFYDQVSSIGDQLLKKNPASFGGLRFRGYVAMIDRKYPEAVDFLKRADAVKPGQSDLVQALVECMFFNHQEAEGEKLALASVGRKPYGPIYDALYNYYMRSNRADRAEQILKSKAAAFPDSVEYRLQLARFYLSVGKDGDATGVFQQMMNDPKHFPDGRLQVGNFYVSINRLEDALRVFQAGAAQDSKAKADYQLHAAQVLAALRRTDQALLLLEDVIKQDPKNINAKALRATINLDSNKPDKLDSAYAELKEILKEKPDDAPLHFQMGRAHLMKGNTDLALAEFQEAIRYDHGFAQAELMAGNIALQKQDYKLASQYADQAYALTHSPASRLLRIASLTGSGDFQDAGNAIGQLDKDFPNAIEPKLKLAEMRLAEKKYAEAEIIYRGLHKNYPRDLRPVEGMLDMFYRQNQYDKAIEFLTGEKRTADSPQIDALLADAALRGHKLDLAVRQYGEMAAANPSSPFGHLRLGDAYLQKGDYPHALEQLQTAKNLAPKDPMANAMLALAYHNSGKTQEAERAYRETMALESNNPLVMNNLAYLMAETGGNLDEALRLAQAASRQQPANLALADTVGWIYLKKNLPDSAIQILKNAVEKDPAQPAYRYHLGAALLRKGDKTGARQELLAALARKPSSSDEPRIRQLLTQSQN